MKNRPNQLGDINFEDNAASELPSPTEDLLSWCISITNEFYGLNVTDLTHSFKDGMAFCAIIHHFRPDLIDYYSLDPNNAKVNLKCAFDASAKLGISFTRPSDMMILDVPDKLSVITNLHQLRAFFRHSKNGATSSNTSLNDADSDDDTSLLGFEWPSSKSSNRKNIFSNTEDHSDSFLFDNLNLTVTKLSDGTLQLGMNSDDSCQQQTSSDSNHDQQSSDQNDHSHPNTSTATKILTNQSQNQMNNRTRKHDSKSSTSNISLTPKPARPILMTRKQLTNPLDSDSEDEELGLRKSHNTPYKRSNSISQSTSSESPKDIIDLANTLEHQQEELSEAVLSFQNPAQTSCNLPVSSRLSSSSSSSSQKKAPIIDSETVTTQSDNPPKQSNHLNPNKNGQPLEIAPGLLDLSPRKVNRLKRVSAGGSNIPFTLNVQRDPETVRLDIRERARKLYAEARKDRHNDVTKPSDDPIENERREKLKQRARSLLAQVKQGKTSLSDVSSLSGSKSQEKQVNVDEKSKIISGKQRNTYPNHNNRINSFDFSRFKFQQDDLPNPGDVNAQKKDSNSKKSYVESELAKLEKEQKEIDREAKIIETKLTFIMNKGGNSVEEERYLRKWFTLVNRRNSLLRRQMKLNILEQEKDLERCYKILCKELHNLLSIDEWDKTDSQRESEKLLIDQLVQIVDRRDELVHHLDTQEKASEEDELVVNATERAVSISEPERSCTIS
ncbi:eps15 homology domain containing protein-binding protein 1 [Brevipalpus obovatus]|uniref:eps15 homology domain containing protein-binding protein 1 n=1 Tax=Brevipalpus obovatus TaxID=246614 RepID=UPI003D9E0A62